MELLYTRSQAELLRQKIVEEYVIPVVEKVFTEYQRINSCTFAVACVMEELEELSQLELIWVDGGYTGKNLARVVKQLCNAKVEVIKRSDDSSGFQVLPRRWVVERTFSWLVNSRRLSLDYELLP